MYIVIFCLEYKITFIDYFSKYIITYLYSRISKCLVKKKNHIYRLYYGDGDGGVQHDKYVYKKCRLKIKSRYPTVEGGGGEKENAT